MHSIEVITERVWKSSTPDADHSSRFVGGARNPPFQRLLLLRRIGFSIYLTFQLKIEYPILAATFGTHHSAGQEKLEISNSILTLF